MLNYNNGGHVLASIAVHDSVPKPRDPAMVTPATKQHVPAKMPEHGASVQGPGSSIDSALGEGDIKIALPLSFPRPEPDLTTLKAQDGKVVIDITIDEVGRVVKLSLVQGLGPSIDDVVLAGIQNWRYVPATLNGAPVESEQEVIFYYKH